MVLSELDSLALLIEDVSEAVSVSTSDSEIEEETALEVLTLVAEEVLVELVTDPVEVPLVVLTLEVPVVEGEEPVVVVLSPVP